MFNVEVALLERVVFGHQSLMPKITFPVNKLVISGVKKQGRRSSALSWAPSSNAFPPNWLFTSRSLGGCKVIPICLAQRPKVVTYSCQNFTKWKFSLQDYGKYDVYVCTYDQKFNLILEFVWGSKCKKQKIMLCNRFVTVKKTTFKFKFDLQNKFLLYEFELT